MFELETEDCTLIIPGPGKGGWVRLVLQGTLSLCSRSSSAEGEASAARLGEVSFD